MKRRKTRPLFRDKTRQLLKKEENESTESGETVEEQEGRMVIERRIMRYLSQEKVQFTEFQISILELIMTN